MIEKIKKLFKLTKISFKNTFDNTYIIDQKTNKLNKKSIYVWLIIIIVLTLSFISSKAIKFLVNINQPEIFLNILFWLLNIIMIFQVILASTNVYFFSKDLEILLPLPIKNEELLISKFNTILINLYFTELVFAAFPLIIYGIITYSSILYYFYLIIILLIFPILTNLIISISMMILIKLSKFIKNKDIFQIIITLIFVFMVFLLEFKIINNLINIEGNNSDIETEQIVQEINNFNIKLNSINKYFLVIDPTVKILNNYNKNNSILYLLKIIAINLIFSILFIFLGKKYYLKNILKNNNYYHLKKINNNNIEKMSKIKNIKSAYLKKEFKILFRNTIFFMQCVFPILILTISFVIIILIGLPAIQKILLSDIFQEKIEFSVDLSVICLVLGMIQLIITTSNISLSAISREGKDAIYMKIIPIDFYKQFIYKSMPQIILNSFLIFVILILIKLIFPIFDFIYLIFIFVLANLLNILNSKIMVLVDLYKPNLNWKADYEAIKNNDNKLFQYVLTIIIILLLVYFYKIFSDINLNISCLLMALILIILLLILNKIIKININKLFRKIY